MFLDNKTDLQEMYQTLMIFPAYILLRTISQNVIAPLILKFQTNKNLHEDIMIQKFKGAVWRSIIYTILLGFGIFTLWNEDWVFDLQKHNYIWPLNEVPYKISIYYKIELVHYIMSLIFIFIEPKMKDFSQMFLHHVVTIYLISASFKIGLLRYGTCIMLLHDFSDPLMEIGKIFYYLRRQKLADNFFMVFAAIFIPARCLIYPIFIVYPVYAATYDENIRFMMYFVKLCLITLAMINYVWALLIVKMACLLVKDGKLKGGDIRADKYTKNT